MDKKEVASKVLSAGGGILSRLGRLMPRGGVRHPDSLVRNRELYIGSGRMPSPIIGPVNSGKALLTGYGPRRRVTRRRRR